MKPIAPADIEKAIESPASYFATPEEVLEHDELTKAQKVEALWRWDFDATEIAVAVEEGMPGDDVQMLRRVLFALGQLVGPLDVEHTGPTKQHALRRTSIDDKK